jgi:hypothetical protein
LKIALVRKLIFLDVRLLHVILRLGNISVSENLRLELLLLLVEILLIEIIRVGVGLKQVVMLLYQSLLTCGWRKPEDLLHVHHLLLVIIERELLNLVKLLLLLLDLLLLYLNCLDLLGQRILSLNRLGGRGRRTWSGAATLGQAADTGCRPTCQRGCGTSARLGGARWGGGA